MIAAKIHGEFNSGDSVLRNDALRGYHERVLQQSGFFVTTALNQFEQFSALFGQSRGQSENGATRTDRQGRIDHRCSAREDREVLRSTGHDFTHALDVSRAVFDADDVGMGGKGNDLRRFERDSGELRN